MNPDISSEFDFDEWARLAREDATSFEHRRQALIERTLEAAPVNIQQRLRGLQFRIDMERERAGTALGAAVRLNSMMWASVMDLREACSGKATGQATQADRPSATLIRFPGRD